MVMGLLFLAPGMAGAAAAPDNGVYGRGPENFSLAAGWGKKFVLRLDHQEVEKCSRVSVS